MAWLWYIIIKAITLNWIGNELAVKLDGFFFFFFPILFFLFLHLQFFAIVIHSNRYFIVVSDLIVLFRVQTAWQHQEVRPSLKQQLRAGHARKCFVRFLCKLHRTFSWSKTANNVFFAIGRGACDMRRRRIAKNERLVLCNFRRQNACFGVFFRIVHKNWAFSTRKNSGNQSSSLGSSDFYILTVKLRYNLVWRLRIPMHLLSVRLGAFASIFRQWIIFLCLTTQVLPRGIKIFFGADD